MTQASIFARLAARREELERAALHRVYAIAEPAETADSEYVEGLRLAVSAALGYGLAALEHGTEQPPPIPEVLLSQARLAARNGVSVDTVLRRYIAGFALFGDFVMGEGEKATLPEGSSVQELIATEAVHFDRLVEAVSEAYTKERERRFRSPEQRQAERVRRLLAGEPVDAGKLGYELEGWHVAAICVGADVEATMRELAVRLDRRLLLVRPREEAIWVWLGGRGRIGAEEVLVHAEHAGLYLAIGEPGEGLEGWRFGHRQAKAALPIAQRRRKAVRYADVCVLACALRDDVFLTSLRRMYLEPISRERDGGAVLRETLRAYFRADRNGSSAAAALGVNRNTFASRLRAAEQRIGCKLSSCGAELDIALRAEEIEQEPIDRQRGEIAPPLRAH